MAGGGTAALEGLCDPSTTTQGCCGDTKILVCL